MSNPTISVIIPTIGRDSLARAVKSCAGADEVIVVYDRAHPDAVRPPVPINGQVHGGDHGYTARTRGIRLATGTHLAFIDDDDWYLPDAFTVMREHAHPDRPVIFRMRHPHGGIIWREPVLEFGNVSTQMFLVPNRPARLGEWEPHNPALVMPGGDYTFIRGCVERMGDPVWRPEMVAEFGRYLAGDAPAAATVIARPASPVPA